MPKDASKNKAICFDNSYVLMGSRFYASVKPTPVDQPRVVKFNYSLARDLGLDLELIEQCKLAEIFSDYTDDPDAQCRSSIW